MSSELIAKALRRAYELGKIYWQQADSESYKQNRLSEGTQQKFEALIEETILAAQAPQAAEPVAWMMHWPNHKPSLTTDKTDYLEHERKHLIPLYLAPQAPAAQPLTDFLIGQLWIDGGGDVSGYGVTRFARAVERAHGIGIAPSAQGEP